MAPFVVEGTTASVAVRSKGATLTCGFWGDRHRVAPRRGVGSVPDIARTAAALADPSRAAMCAALMDGRTRTPAELATSYCGLARSTATEHVDVLVANGLVTETRQGRHRYLNLAGEHIARVIEELGLISGATLRTAPSLRFAAANERLRAGRTCYRHLAGRLGVDLADRFATLALVDDGWQQTPAGRRLLERWCVTGAATASASVCMDSTERRFHLAGQLGTGLCRAFFDNGRIEGSGTPAPCA